MSNVFKNDPKDRKRRFLRGLNYLLGLNYSSLEDKITPLSWFSSRVKSPAFRNNLANIYGLEFTSDELKKLIDERITTGEFTEKYCEAIYRDRGNVDLNTLIGSSMLDGAIDLREMDKALKYGLNGSEWCDVSEGLCSCGAWH